MPISRITPRELAEKTPDARIVVDVLPPEYFAAAHLPGAVNQCVYEMIFVDEAVKRFTDWSKPIVVYSAGPGCLGAEDAAEKLAKVGFADVRILEGGLEGWIAAGLPVEGDPAAQPASPHLLNRGDETLPLDPAACRIGWTGRNRNGAHLGVVDLVSGLLRFEAGVPVEFEAVVDMTSLKNTDLPDPTPAAMLIAHLSSVDFFDAAKHPTARFKSGAVEVMPDALPGTPNHRAAGELTLRGKSHPVAFPLTIERLDDGRIAVEAHTDLDRTCWNALYGSGKHFQKLGMHLVHDVVSISARFVAGKAPENAA